MLRSQALLCLRMWYVTEEIQHLSGVHGWCHFFPTFILSFDENLCIANVTVLGEMQRFHSIKRKEFHMSCLMAQGERFLPLNLLSERFVDLVFPLPSSSKNLGNLNLLGNLHVIAD